MFNRLFIRFKFIAIALFIVGLVSAAVGYAMKQPNGVKLKPAKGFTLVTRETAINSQPGPSAESYVIVTRHEKSNGTWKQVRTFHQSDGKPAREDITFGIPGKGVFQVDQARGTLNFISSMPPKEQTSYFQITDGRDHPNFLKEEVVQGYATYVLRFLDEDGGYVDLYRAPELNNRTIKMVKVSNSGVAVEEPVQIILSDPDEKIFEHLPNWHVRYGRFEEKIKAIEEGGQPETAKAMRQQMERQIDKSPRNK